MEDHRVVFPEGGSVRHGQQCDSQFGCVVHHESLHVWGYQRGCLVEDCVLDSGSQFPIKILGFTKCYKPWACGRITLPMRFFACRRH